MPLKDKLVLAAFASAFVLLVGCQHPRLVAGPPGHSPNRAFEIHIYADSNKGCLVDVNVATLWVKDTQSVNWFSDDVNYYIEFPTGPGHNGSPFDNSSHTNWYEVSNGSPTPSGKLKNTAGGSGPAAIYYDYVIYKGTAQNHPDQCKDVSDPGFYVK
jgi:hypothetical protein